MGETDLAQITYNQLKQTSKVRFHSCDDCPNNDDCRDYQEGRECMVAQRMLPRWIEVYTQKSWITPEDLPLIRRLAVLEILAEWMEVRGEITETAYRATVKEIRMLRAELALTPASRIRYRKQKKEEEGSLDIWSRD